MSLEKELFWREQANKPWFWRILIAHMCDADERNLYLTELNHSLTLQAMLDADQIAQNLAHRPPLSLAEN